jgi:hypothetical protein
MGVGSWHMTNTCHGVGAACGWGTKRFCGPGSGSDGIMGNSARRIALSQLAKDTIFPIDFMLTHIF